MNHSLPSFFEGTEKKFELVVDPSLPSLRERGREFWDQIVRRADARVLSVLSNGHCDAYLLSESSLFVFDHKLVMITCGRTRLPSAALGLLEQIPDQRVRLFTYERKNEVFPHSQPTSFFDDVALLDAHLPGKAYQFGEEDEHHLYLFHLDRPFAPAGGDVTVEVLMYDLDPAVRPEFTPAAAEGVRARVGLDRLLPGFRYHDHAFQPSGYSLNGLRDEYYLTIHVTPEQICSYASFETNYRFSGDLDETVGRVLKVFGPRSFDVIVWERGTETGISEHGYRLKAHVAQQLSCGYRVRFMNFYRPQGERVRGAIELPIVRARV